MTSQSLFLEVLCHLSMKFELHNFKLNLNKLKSVKLPYNYISHMKRIFVIKVTIIKTKQV